MREILFRGQMIISGQWDYGFYVEGTHICGDEGKGRAYICDPSNPLFSEVNPETVGQYTGLTDVNGTKIFEGDIVKARFRPQLGYKSYAVGKVIFENGTFKIAVYISSNTAKYKEFTDKNAKNYPIEHNFIDRLYKLEVIDNVYDNPELLKGELDG